MTSRFAFDRPGRLAFALGTGVSVRIAIGNDYGYEHQVARLVQAVDTADDVLFVILTSGRFQNIAAKLAPKPSQGLVTVGMTVNRRVRDGRDRFDRT